MKKLTDKQRNANNSSYAIAAAKASVRKELVNLK